MLPANQQRTRRLRQITQGLLFLTFLGLIGYGLQASGDIRRVVLLMRIDPLAGISASLSAKELLIGFWPSAAMILLGLLLGRVWCGWLCPLGSLVDWISPRHPTRIRVHEKWRSVKYVLLFLILFGALWGSLTLLLIDPLSIFTRSISGLLLPTLSWLLDKSQTLLYRTGHLEWLVNGIDGFGNTILPGYGRAYYAGSLVSAGLLGAILGLNWIAPRFWCRYLCPLGGLYAILSKLAGGRFPWLKRCVDESCISCDRCERTCPMGTIDGERGYASDSGECILCYDCVSDCPADAIVFRTKWEREAPYPYDPSRRQALAAMGGSLAFLAALRIGADRHTPDPYRLHPPGVDEAAMLARCIRCGACLRVCPTHGLQPSIIESSWEGVATPILVPRLGQCDYSCNACGRVCPTGAIPALPLERKRETPLGKAYIDQNLCIAWSGRAPCIVCEEVCPIAGKAITLEEKVFAQDEQAYTLQVPIVSHEDCIGCGLCENKCPVQGSAAIRVRLDPLGF